MKVSGTTTSTQMSFVQQSQETEVVAGLPPASPQPGGGDRLEISDEARRKARAGHGIRQLAQIDENADRKMMDFLSSLVRALSGREVSGLDLTPETEEAAAGIPAPSTEPRLPLSSGSIEQTTVNLEQQTFSFSGMIRTADGREVEFALDLQFTHATFDSRSLAFQAGPEGTTFSFEGTSAELTSTSFSFSLAATDTDADRAKGIGRFNIGDDLAKIRKLLKDAV